MMRMNDSLRTKNIEKVYRSLFPIQAFAAGLPAINTLLDSFIIGNYIGVVGLTVVGFISPLLLLISAISGTVSSGAQLLCGQAIGRADNKKISDIYTVSLLMCLIPGVFLTALTQFAPVWIAEILGAPTEYLTETANYIKGTGIGILFMLLNSTILPYLQLDQSKKTSTAMIVAMLVFNVGGDFASVLLFDGGMYGVGLATSLSFIASVLIGISKLAGSKLFRLHPSEMHFKTVIDICRLGLPDGFMSICIMCRNRIANHYVFLYGGAIGMSAMSIANSITTAFGNVVQSGYSGSARLVSSVLIGQRDVKGLRDLPKIMIKNVWWMFAGLYALVFVFAGPLALLFGADSANIETYKIVIRLFNLWYLFIIPNEPALSIYQGMEKITFISLLRVVNIFAPFAVCALFGPVFGLPAAVCITWTSDIVTICILIIVFTVKAKRLPRVPFELAYIPSSVAVPPDDRYRATIQTLDDAVKASEEVINFCRSRGIDQQKAYYCGLCVEEMATDTIKHGFKKATDTVDLSVLVENGQVRLLFRDLGKEFSPVQWLNLCHPEEAERSIGIRMVTKLATDMKYINTLGMNTLTIHI